VGCAGAALVAAGCGLTNSSSSTTTVTVTRTVTHTVTTAPVQAEASACKGSDLSGTFSVEEGSAGAGGISYALRVTNDSQSECFLAGVPEVQLVDANANELQTRATEREPDTAVKVTLAPGATAMVEARFSPSVTPCNRTPAATLRVTATGGGTLDAPFAPATPVCDGGAMVLSAFAAG
jgi:hypothetical protein